MGVARLAAEEEDLVISKKMRGVRRPREGRLERRVFPPMRRCPKQFAGAAGRRVNQFTVFPVVLRLDHGLRHHSDPECLFLHFVLEA